MLMYKNGDASAFENLYLRHKGPVYRYVLRHCSDKSIAEELFQDIWMKLINARERYEVKAAFNTYLYQIAHNRIIDHFRKAKTGSFEANDSEIDLLQSRQQDQPEIHSEIQQQNQKILDCIAKLPADQREVFLLKEEAGMSIQAIAETMGINAETAKSRLRYAVKKLRQALDE